MLLILLLAAQAAHAGPRIADDALASHPYFDVVQPVYDPAPARVDADFAERFRLDELPHMTREFPAPTSAELAESGGLLERARAVFRANGVEPWFRAAPARAVSNDGLPATIDLSLRGRRFSSETLEKLGRLLVAAHRAVPDPQAVPVLVLNAYLYKVDARSPLFPAPIGAHAFTRPGVRQLRSLTGVAVPDRPLILVANNPWLGAFFADVDGENHSLLAHELGHLVGLVHSRAPGNLMRVPTTRAPSLDEAQKRRIADWAARRPAPSRR